MGKRGSEKIFGKNGNFLTKKNVLEVGVICKIAIFANSMREV